MPTPEPPQPLPVKRPLLPLVLAALGVVVVGTIAVFAAYGLLGRRAAPVEETVPPSPTATPTPIRTPSAIASQSAFLSLESSVASLSSRLQAIPLSDPGLAPPVLNLELGFEL